MASIQFFVRSKKSNTKIALRMYISRDCQPYATTGLTVNGKLWSEKKQKLKGNDEYTQFINTTLDKLYTFLIQESSMDYAKGVIISSQWLEEKIKTYFHRPTTDKTISEELYEFIESNPTVKGKRLSKNTLDNYKQTAVKLKQFNDCYPARINLKYHANLLKHLKSEGYAPNTISKYFAILKSFLFKLEDKGVSISEDVKKKDFFIPPEISTDSIYLTEEQIEKIRNLKTKSERLTKTKDNFILGLRTGLRVSDFLTLHEYNVNDDFIEVTTQKTDNKVIIPIHKDVRDILVRNNGLPDNLSDQKFNAYIKELCQKAGLDQLVYGSKVTTVAGVKRKRFGQYPFYELVSSHICRRSFATNLYGKLPNLTIMAITGHKTETNFIKYVKLSSKEHAEKLKAYWEK